MWFLTEDECREWIDGHGLVLGEFGTVTRKDATDDVTELVIFPQKHEGHTATELSYTHLASSSIP